MVPTGPDELCFMPHAIFQENEFQENEWTR